MLRGCEGREGTRAGELAGQGRIGRAVLLPVLHQLLIEGRAKPRRRGSSSSSRRPAYGPTDCGICKRCAYSSRVEDYSRCISIGVVGLQGANWLSAARHARHSGETRRETSRAVVQARPSPQPRSSQPNQPSSHYPSLTSAAEQSRSNAFHLPPHHIPHIHDRGQIE